MAKRLAFGAPSLDVVKSSGFNRLGLFCRLLLADCQKYEWFLRHIGLLIAERHTRFARLAAGDRLDFRSRATVRMSLKIQAQPGASDKEIFDARIHRNSEDRQ